ncbi:MAG: hypothetical protein IT520_06645 [Burkholderiales bacterium]|nr:hypothetical protein [Burkholderiales bacterium]
MTFGIDVVSKSPPGGRCALYAGYAEVLAAHLHAAVRIRWSSRPDAHGDGYPSLLIDGVALAPTDGVLLMPDDICAALRARGCGDDALAGLAGALEAPLERMMDAAG